MKPTIVFLLLSAISQVCSAQTQCDLEVIRQADPKDRDHYFQRDKNRCEGVYLEQVAGTVGSLLVASLTGRRGVLAQWPVNGPLTFRWNQFASGEVHIQAFPVVPRKFFRLDVFERGAAEYAWNTDLVAKYLTPAEVGLVAWTLAPIDGRNQRVYLPIAVGSGAPKGPYRVTLVSSVDLSELYITVASIAPGEKPLRVNAPLRFGSYPANQKIEVDLPPLPKAGLYRVEFVGDRRDQGSVAAPQFFVNHSP